MLHPGLQTIHSFSSLSSNKQQYKQQAHETAAMHTYCQEVWHGAAAKAALLAAAAHLRFQAHPRAAADVDGANPLRPVQLMPADGEQVDVHGVDVDGDLAHRLYKCQMLWMGLR